MELSEAFRRIVVQHRRLLAVCLALGIVIPLALSFTGGKAYTATTRFTLNTADPTDESQATALADGARAVVTSPEHVSTALAASGLQTDPVAFAKDAVRLRALGSSGVLELAVTWSDPQTAAGVANALVKDLIDTRNAMANGSQQYLDTLNVALSDTISKQRRVQADINDLQAQIDAAGGDNANPALVLERSGLERNRNDLSVQRQSLENEIRTVQANVALQPQATVIDPASPPPAPAPSGRTTALALGAMLGLLAGLAIAAVSEVFRPTVAGPDVAARMLGTRVLGSATRRGPVFAPLAAGDPTVVRLRLAAGSSGVSSVELIGVPSSLPVRSLAYRLNAALDAGPRGRGPRNLAVRAFGADGAVPVEHISGAVVVAEPFVSQRALDDAQDLLALAELPLLGIVVARPQGRRGRTGRDDEGPATEDQIVLLPTEHEPASRPSAQAAPAPAPVAKATAPRPRSTTSRAKTTATKAPASLDPDVREQPPGAPSAAPSDAEAVAVRPASGARPAAARTRRVAPVPSANGPATVRVPAPPPPPARTSSAPPATDPREADEGRAHTG